MGDFLLIGLILLFFLSCFVTIYFYDSLSRGE